MDSRANLLTYTNKRIDADNRGWQWDLSKIKALNITDNVVELMISISGKKIP